MRCIIIKVYENLPIRTLFNGIIENVSSKCLNKDFKLIDHNTTAIKFLLSMLIKINYKLRYQNRLAIAIPSLTYIFKE